MRRHRSGAPQQEDSSSDEEDAFAILSKKNKKAKIKEEPSTVTTLNVEDAPSASGTTATSSKPLPEASEPAAVLPVSITSSMKRHHGASSNTRKAKMDALLLELEVEKSKVRTASTKRSGSRQAKGSFVETGQEHTTTNVFVGNLVPTMTEERLTHLFQQFGPLYSVKIMWPRSPEDARNRLTGFVCFMNRSDAEDAMDACDDSDPFNCGRKIVLRWGKNVKEVVPQGDGVISRIHTDAQQADPATTGAIEARPKTMRVIPPRDLRKNGTRGGAHLTPEELEEFRRLTRRELCAARGPICQAMAFCFEKSAAAKAIADMLKELLLDSAPDVTVDTLIARLYLISDVLYNSQQPGVRNAFLYRDAIERMAPDVFTILGKHGDGKVGRMTLNKLSKAVSTVLSAWTNWSVYNPVFLDELHARFEGREVQQELVAPIKKEEQAEVAIDQGVEQVPVVDTISTTPQGDWTTLTVDEDEDEIGLDEEDEVDGEPINDHEINSAVVKENDQPPVMSPGDASSSYGELPSTRISGQPQVDDDVDGIPLDEGDPDGEPLESDEEVDGEPWDMDDADADGVPLDDED